MIPEIDQKGNCDTYLLCNIWNYPLDGATLLTLYTGSSIW